MNEVCGLCFFQRVLRPAGQEILPHAHTCHELVYYVSGAGRARLGDGEGEIAPGRYQFVPAGTMHGETHEAEAEVMFLGFTCGDAALLPDPGVQEDGRDLPALYWVRRVMDEARAQPVLHREMISALLTALLITLRRKKSPAAPRRSLQYAARFIRENYHQPLSLKGLAADCGYGYDYFQHQFKRETGESPQRYLMRQRLENARRLLSSGVSCTAAAYACGFSNAAQFSALFKRAYGTPPRACRKSGGAEGRELPSGGK